ncbi:hypothetical protein [Georgenia deserti]|uniref:DUF3180 family protein n=1 Tax=Georgenia deserti TaxID=2093781 RepID=A0ABW4KY82_9MICO
MSRDAVDEQGGAVPDGPVDAESRWEQRLALPVLVAALASVPAVWLTLLDEPYSTVGRVGSWVTGAVLVAETVVLFVVTGDRWAWVRRNAWLIVLTAAVVVAVVLAIGPVQILRLVRAIGALRVLRVRHIIRAGRKLRGAGSSRWWERVWTAVATLVVAAFVAVVLSDPTSRSRQLVEELLGRGWFVVAVVVAGLLLGGAVFVLMRRRSTGGDDRDATEA